MTSEKDATHSIFSQNEANLLTIFPQGEGVLRAQRDKINRVRTFKSFEPFRGKNPSTTFKSEIKKTRFHSQKTHFQIRKNTFLQSGHSTQRAQKHVFTVTILFGKAIYRAE